jgi:hypothetical protein
MPPLVRFELVDQIDVEEPAAATPRSVTAGNAISLADVLD